MLTGNVTSSKKYVFFISHSTKDVMGEVGEVCNIFEKCRISSFVADRDAPLGEPLPERIKKAIDESELFLVFLTKNSKKSLWVNQEIGYALGKGIPLIPLKKGKTSLKGLIESAKYVKIQDNPIVTVKDVFSRLSGWTLSPRAEAAILAFVGAMELREKPRGGADGV